MSLPLAHNYIEQLTSDRWSHRFMLHQIEPLFAKPEPKEKEAANAPAAPEPSYITIDDFAKIELVVGTVTECQVVEKSEKLYRLQVDFGPLGKRQILSGVRQSYGVDELVGKQGIFVLNLKPRMMAGFESQGMFLFAKDETGKAIMTTVGSNVPNGTKVT